MQLFPLKLVTVVGESVVIPMIAEEGLALGASGYTLTEALGEDTRVDRSLINHGGSTSMKCEFVVYEDVALAILAHVADVYFEHYACVAWLADVQVMRGESYFNRRSSGAVARGSGRSR